MALFFAVCSLVFAAGNDLVFKLYAQTKLSRGLYVAIIGLIWFVVFCGLALGWGLSGELSSGLVWGAISGGLGVLANILLIESLAGAEVGVGATIYRLNLAPAAFLAILLLDETVSGAKLVGLGAAVAAVLLFLPGSAKSRAEGSLVGRAIALAALACLLRAGMGLSYKWGLLLGADRNVLLALNGACWVVGGLLYCALEPTARIRRSGRIWLLGLVSGGLVCGIVLFLALGLQLGEASLVLPVAQLSFIATALVGVLALGESRGLRKMGGLACGLACILFMAWA